MSQTSGESVTVAYFFAPLQWQGNSQHACRLRLSANTDGEFELAKAASTCFTFAAWMQWP
jgi:hypothetical protein